MATLGATRINFGTFAGTTTGATITGRGISYRLDGTFVATVVVEFQDNGHDDFVVARTDTTVPAAQPIVITDTAERNWRVRCSAYTSGSPKYSIQSQPATAVQDRDKRYETA